MTDSTITNASTWIALSFSFFPLLCECLRQIYVNALDVLLLHFDYIIMNTIRD